MPQRCSILQVEIMIIVANWRGLAVVVVVVVVMAALFAVGVGDRCGIRFAACCVINSCKRTVAVDLLWKNQ